MNNMRLGLTKTYNLFHDPAVGPQSSDLSSLDTQLRKSGATITATEAAARIQTLRDLHVEMDHVALAAYGWADLSPGHGFHEVDFLPENDRVRFTISPAARREVLKRLLEINHKYHAEEGEGSNPGKRNRKSGKVPDQLGLGY